MFPGLYYDYDVGEWKAWDLADVEVEQIEFACLFDRQNLTLGGTEGLKLLCHACKVRAELVNVKLQPEQIRCPSCGIIGSVDSIFEKAREYAVFEKNRNNERVSRLGIRWGDTFSDINEYLLDERDPSMPAFAFR